MSPKTNSNYEYYLWLVSQVRVPNRKTYAGVFEAMHLTEFVWTVPHDDNRIQDGRDLRHEFLPKGFKTTEWVSFLEVLISLSRHLEFVAGGPAHDWAWKLMKNIGLTRFPDDLTADQMERIQDNIQRVIWRTYSPDGHGGFFPLLTSCEDQRKVELWYQLNAYVIERDGG